MLGKVRISEKIVGKEVNLEVTKLLEKSRNCLRIVDLLGRKK